MPATRGNIHHCDYGPVIGNELSGKRPALIISTTDVNRKLRVTVTLPMSRTLPKIQHQRNHIHIAGPNSWASVRQIKFIDQGKLGDFIAQATPQEMDKVLETLIERLASTERQTKQIGTTQGVQNIEKGTVWQVQFEDSDKDHLNHPLLILDYNNGNQMAIAIQLQQEQSHESQVKVPLEINKLNGMPLPATALVHRIRSIDLSARPLEKLGSISQDSLNSVNSTLLALLDPKQAGN